VVLENPNGIDCVRKDETELLLLYCRFDRCDAVERYFQPEIDDRVLIVCACVSKTIRISLLICPIAT
jgi:hypothetical protein